MKRTWVLGRTLGRFFVGKGKERRMYHFVDDRHGGRQPATDLEVLLWRSTVGPIPYGPDDPRTETRTKGPAK